MELKSLELKNFKGIKSLKVDFKDGITTISGRNGAGKTTLMDAYLWILFDKDSTDRSSFEIKTLNKNGEAIHNLEHSVKAQIDNTILEKVYKEKWTKKRGSIESDFSGHTTEYFIDDVPRKKGEYQDFIKSLINEETFKLLSNPLYFSMKMNWKDRRKMLLGGVKSGINFQGFEDDMAKLKYQKKKLNEALKEIPARIDELKGTIYQGPDRDELKSRLNRIDSDIAELTKERNGAVSKRSGILRDLETFKTQLHSEIQKIRRENHDAIGEYEEKKRTIQNNISELKEDITSAERRVHGIGQEIYENEKKMEELRKEYREIHGNEFIFNEAGTVCPLCKQDLPTGDIKKKKETLKFEFEEQKKREISEINTKGKALKSLNGKLSQQASEMQENINSEREKIEELEKMLEEMGELKIQVESFPDIEADIAKLEARLEETDPGDADTGWIDDAIQKKEAEKADILFRQAQLDASKAAEKRIEDLEAEEADISRQYSQIEKVIYEEESALKTAVESLTGEINSKFKHVSFKLFDEQINGGIVETCEAMISGVPYQDANTASQYNAGIDIINTISAERNVSAPIWVDHAESISELIQSDNQIIRLVVDETKQKLEVM